MSRSFRPWFVLLAGGFACLVCSCSRDPLKRQAVSGTVTFKGRPLEAGNIEFSPKGSQGTLVAGSIENGRYAIPAAKGLSPGEYLVRVNAPDRVSRPSDNVRPDALGPPPKELIPPRYNAQTQLRATVQEGGSNVFDFNLE